MMGRERGIAFLNGLMSQWTHPSRPSAENVDADELREVAKSPSDQGHLWVDTKLPSSVGAVLKNIDRVTQIRHGLAQVMRRESLWTWES